MSAQPSNEHPAQAEDAASPRGVAPPGAQSVPQIVGIGASAGGLEALEELFTALPTNSGCAFVVVQHLSPDFKSLMVELLARYTSMPIHRVEDGMRVAANEVYLIPPRKEMVLEGGELRLRDSAANQQLKLPIDVFFASLAAEQGERAIGIVLSGTGSDGSRGACAIHDAGGMVLVQEPGTAQFDGMPRSAVATGAVDFVGAPETMPRVLEAHLQNPRTGPGARADSGAGARDEDLQRIMDVLQQSSGIDFSEYKRGTVLRRVKRRILLSSQTGMQAYLDRLADNPKEAEALYKDLLIGVTRFFRDDEAFAALARTAIADLVERHADDTEIRVWVPACASGEEAYSLAILLDEAFSASSKRAAYRVFASDLHRDSLDHAALGVYPDSALAAVSRQRHERFFVRRDDGYQIVPEIRRRVVFANHNLLTDPPFIRMDLVTCRNLLIYFEQSAQHRALSVLHFALNRDGYLFLGPSESLGAVAPEFDTVDAAAQIFRKRRDVRLNLPVSNYRPPPRPRATSACAASPGHGAAVTASDPVLRSYDHLLDRFIPPSLLILESGELLHAFADGGRFLKPLAGRSSLNVLRMLDEHLRIAVQTAIPRALRDREPITFSGVTAKVSGRTSTLNVTVEVLPTRSGSERQLLVSFQESVADARAGDGDTAFNLDHQVKERIAELEHELQLTRNTLQTTVEDLEASNEELQATNEELMASNEELQSTNEELHSVNEELYTVNAEHHRKIDELQQVTDDLENLLRSSDIGKVFLDRELRVRRFTPAAMSAFNLLPHDHGRPLEHIASDFVRDGLMNRVRAVLETGTAEEAEVQDGRGTWHLLRVLPYHTAAGAVDGVVITVTDVSRLKASQAALRERTAEVERSNRELSGQQHLLDLIINSMNDGVVVADADGSVACINPTAQRLTGIKLRSRSITEWDKRNGTFEPDGTTPIAGADLPLARALAGAEVSDRLLLLRNDGHPDGIYVSANATPLRDEATAAPRGAVMVFRDVTERRRTEAHAAALEIARHGRAAAEAERERLYGLFMQAPALIAVHEGREHRYILSNPLQDEAAGRTGLVGRSLREALPESGDQDLLARFDRVFTTGNPELCFEVAAKRERNGATENRYFNQVLCPWRRPDGGIGGVMSFAFEVSELVEARRRAEAAQAERQRVVDELERVNATLEERVAERTASLARTAAELERSNADLQQFAYIASHDMREPLRKIVSFAELLERERDGFTGADARQYVKIMVDAARRAQTMVNDMLALAQAGSEHVNGQPVDLDRVLDRVLDTLGDSVQAAGAQVERAGRLPTVSAHAGHMEQLFSNLIGNALKFVAADRPPRVRVWSRPTAEDASRVTVHVADNGIGFHPTAARRIFEPFRTAHERGVSGNGIGLAICEKIVRRHGGKITATATEGQGAEFVINMPAETAVAEGDVA